MPQDKKKKKNNNKLVKICCILNGVRRVAYRIRNLSCCPIFFFLLLSFIYLFFVTDAAELNRSVAMHPESYFTLAVSNVLSFFPLNLIRKVLKIMLLLVFNFVGPQNR